LTREGKISSHRGLERHATLDGSDKPLILLLSGARLLVEGDIDAAARGLEAHLI